ncbi:T9SS-dependent choice-of-anchor J family protein [Chryseobacterium paridis]|uniref:T9SS type A sorting domain-containing protein n=1 Tax=Chryseobacterium paridis TaxID=2800328 RepID=A0ABS1FTQ9_9FLAO|nr:choice-of-anchor J domain-containing protein [Chryseobacterium paridis]MBK1895808.1 T9SS type A sorting domain-containing protein [Chryseobacterium paridis]
MNLKLLFGALVFSTITANAQLATINENFNAFAEGQGQTVFPQNQWNNVFPAAVGNPPPMMNVVASGSNKFVQSYSGANQNSPQYLISPQIVTPTGDKTLSFKARRNTGSAPGTIQVGLVSSPSDMTTFVALGNPTMLTSDVFQTYSFPVPASTSSYIAFKFVGAIAPHTVLELDDVTYVGALSTSNVAVASKENIKFAVNTENTALQFIAKKDPKNIQVYSAAGQKVAEGKLNNQRFDISKLQTGIYYIAIETAEGSVTQSKFIKK